MNLIFCENEISSLLIFLDVEKAEILSKYEIHEKSDAVTNLQIQKHRLRHAKGNVSLC